MDKQALEIWDDYALALHDLWGIERKDLAYLGNIGNVLFEAEFSHIGPKAYETSVALPIRNLFYSAYTTPQRWKVLSQYDMQEPILDYGCGVGFLLRWLQREGFEQLYWYELPSVQRTVVESILEDEGIMLWQRDIPKSFGTVLCLNVLEHLEDPMHTLRYLRSISDRVIANCADDDSKHQHVASSEAIREVITSLREHNELYGEIKCP